MTALEYHTEKRHLTQEKGIEILFVWESDWIKTRRLVLEELSKFIDARTIGANPTVPELFQKLTGKN